jgi:hypothetical protein
VSKLIPNLGNYPILPMSAGHSAHFKTIALFKIAPFGTALQTYTYKPVSLEALTLVTSAFVICHFQ